MMSRQNIVADEYKLEELEWALNVKSLPISEARQLALWEPKGSLQRAKVMQQLKKLSCSFEIPPLHPDLKDLSTPELMSKLRRLIKMKNKRGLWNIIDSRKDLFEITDNCIRANFSSTAGIFTNDALNDAGNGYWEIRTKHYGKKLNLCQTEFFYDQPSAAGSLCTGVLVKKNVILTAAHFIKGNRSINDLRIIFGFAMINPHTAITKFPGEKIYRATGVVYSREDSKLNGTTGSDWALVTLDREVKDQPIVTMSQDTVFTEESIFLFGFPLGLPLKLSFGSVAETNHIDHFMAHVDVFMGNSGSPLFSAETHKMVGMVIKTDSKDFIRTAKGLKAIHYPNNEIASCGAKCLRVSEFSKYIQG
jgi:hypothetical protein